MSLINVTATGNNLLKTGGCDGCPDASAVSEQQMAGTGLATFTASEAGTLRVVGLATGGVGTLASDINYALRLQNGVAEVREFGAYKAEIGFGAGDTLQISVEAGIVKYTKNGAVFYVSDVAATSALRLHVAMFNAGAAVDNVTFATAGGGVASTAPLTVSESSRRIAQPRPAGSSPVRRGR